MTLGAAAPAAPEPAALASNGPTSETAPAADQAALPEATPSVAAAPDELTASEAEASEPAASAPAADDTGISEAPLDMAEFITTDTGARESTPAAADKTSPIILGGIEGDAGTLIEASPAIDSPAKSSSLDESQAFGSSDDDTAAPPASAEPAAEPPAEPIAESIAEPIAAPAEEKEPEPMNATPAPAAMAAMAPSPEPAPEPPIEPPIEPPREPIEIPAAGAMSEGRSAGDAGPGEDADDREANMEEGASSVSGAVTVPGNSAGLASADDEGEQGGRDETRTDDSTRMVETHLTTLLGLKVSIAERNRDDGVLSIHYNSESELTDLVSRLNRMPTGRRAE
jgi:hypothetical protein